jgi:hypothetical protein
LQITAALIDEKVLCAQVTKSLTEMETGPASLSLGLSLDFLSIQFPQARSIPCGA